MKKLVLLVVNLFCMYYIEANAQDIKIYHGRNGETKVLDKSNGNLNSDNVIIKPKGTKIEIEIINPNPIFYSYEFKSDEFEIKDDTPNFSAVLPMLNALAGLSSGSNDIAQHMSDDIGNDTKAKKKKTKTAAELKLDSYANALQLLKNDITNAQKFISKLDEPEELADGLLKTEPDYEAGFRYAQKAIKNISNEKGRFNSLKLEEELNSYLPSPANAEQTLIIEALKLNNKTISESIKKIKESITARSVTNIIKHVVSVSENKQLKLTLTIKKKGDNSDVVRDVKDILVTTIEPEFHRTNLELIPVLNVSYASNVSKFSIKNSVITEEEDDGFRFKPGAMLVYYPWKFGKYKEGALGFGLGLNVPKDQSLVENLYGGAIVSYKNNFRIGFGLGFAEYPGRLKDGIQTDSNLPSNVSNIEDLVIYQRKPSVFLTFTVLGLSLPSLKL